MIPGVFWPALWLNADTSDALNRSGVNVENDPTILVKTMTILCSDVLNNATILLTFGLCSPVLATAVVCVVVLKMRFLELQVARFAVAVTGDCYETLQQCRRWGTFASSTGGIRSGAVSIKRSVATVVLADGVASALFFALVCWDMACDEVTWLELFSQCNVCHTSILLRSILLQALSE
jgi:hypothetical protein